MSPWLILLWWVVVVQRIGELAISARNSSWMKSQGGVEIGKDHYKLIVFIHGLFFAGIWLEKFFFHTTTPAWAIVPFVMFILTQILRYWCIRSLGKYWNTRIWIVPGHTPQAKGPYKYLRHPNYVVVAIELLVFPVIFGAYLTAAIVTIMNTVIMLLIRIPLEEHALYLAMNYEEEMGEKPRFLPSWNR